jgi:hypothetical protein
MNRNLTYFIGPELVLAVLSALVYWICARHNSGEGKDILVMEKIVMLLPFVVTPLVFLTIFVPGGRSWVWLGRAIILTYTMLLVCGGRAITGFGTGAKGQDAAFMLIIGFGTIAITVGATVAVTMILFETKPAFAEWYRNRKVLGSLLTVVSAAPIGLILGGAVLGIFCFVAFGYALFKR